MTTPDDSSSIPEMASANPWGVFLGTVGVLAVVALGYHFFESDVFSGRGAGHWKWHVGYWAVALVTIVVSSVAPSISQYIFSDLTQTAVGCALPVYESIRACCSAPEDDDKLWLQYWMLGGLIFMLTTWVDDIMKSETATEYWFENMIFLFYWLYFPKTQGAKLVYERLTKPYLSPLLEPVLGKVDDFLSYLYGLLINAGHLWFLWIIFFFLPRGLKRIVAIFVGTAYPFLSSMAAAATEDIDDDTYWLTYWSVYGVLFLLMDILYVANGMVLDDDDNDACFFLTPTLYIHTCIPTILYTSIYY